MVPAATTDAAKAIVLDASVDALAAARAPLKVRAGRLTVPSACGVRLGGEGQEGVA
jgi:hypothetical protein